MGFIIYFIFIIFAIRFVCYVNRIGEWFIMELLQAVVALMFGIIIGIIMGLAISDC